MPYLTPAQIAALTTQQAAVLGQPGRRIDHPTGTRAGNRRPRRAGQQSDCKSQATADMAVLTQPIDGPTTDQAGARARSNMAALSTFAIWLSGNQRRCRALDQRSARSRPADPELAYQSLAGSEQQPDRQPKTSQIAAFTTTELCCLIPARLLACVPVKSVPQLDPDWRVQQRRYCRLVEHCAGWPDHRQYRRSISSNQITAFNTDQISSLSTAVIAGSQHHPNRFVQHRSDCGPNDITDSGHEHSADQRSGDR